MSRYDLDINQNTLSDYLRFYTDNGTVDVAYCGWTDNIKQIIEEQEKHYKSVYNKSLKIIRIEDYLTGQLVWEK